MPEFEGTSQTPSLQEALEDAVRKAYTAHQKRAPGSPFSYVVKRISGQLSSVTVVIDTVADERETKGTVARDDHAPVTTKDPIKELVERQRRGEQLTANEQALIDLLLQGPKSDG
jgi:hypothetical protein